MIFYVCRLSSQYVCPDVQETDNNVFFLSLEFLSQGCTLKFLLDWTWNKVVQIKQCVDNTCKLLLFNI